MRFFLLFLILLILKKTTYAVLESIFLDLFFENKWSKLPNLVAQVFPSTVGLFFNNNKHTSKQGIIRSGSISTSKGNTMNFFGSNIHCQNVL